MFKSTADIKIMILTFYYVYVCLSVEANNLGQRLFGTVINLTFTNV